MAQWLIGALLMMSASLAFGLGFSGIDLSGKACTGGAQGYGPFDYTNPVHVKTKLGIVEHHHFSPEVERLVRGKSSNVLGDLDYTLRAFPNHHRALYAVIRFVIEPGHENAHSGELLSQPECYLQRALRFKGDDGKVHLLFGLYLHKLGKLSEAESYYRNAIKLMPRNAEAHYNLGLLLTDQDRFDEALPVAKKAYQYGYPLSGLRRRLATAGHSLN